jgi:hypothetical protein
MHDMGQVGALFLRLRFALRLRPLYAHRGRQYGESSVETTPDRSAGSDLPVYRLPGTGLPA